MAKIKDVAKATNENEALDTENGQTITNVESNEVETDETEDFADEAAERELSPELAEVWNDITTATNEVVKAKPGSKKFMDASFALYTSQQARVKALNAHKAHLKELERQAFINEQIAVVRQFADAVIAEYEGPKDDITEMNKLTEAKNQLREKLENMVIGKGSVKMPTATTTATGGTRNTGNKQRVLALYNDAINAGITSGFDSWIETESGKNGERIPRSSAWHILNKAKKDGTIAA